jgi:hypothetical protein
MKISILGTDYSIRKVKYDKEPEFRQSGSNGYCSNHLKQIVYCDMRTYPGWEEEPDEAVLREEKQTLRHEIVHAFLNESGLCASACRPDGAWSRNEEMVDWIALQGEKLYAAWEKANAL